MWKPDALDQLDKIAEDTVRSFLSEASELYDTTEREEFLRWIKQSGNRHRQRAMLEQARHHLKIAQEMLDRSPEHLNLVGQIANLKTGQVSRADPNAYCTRQVSIKFNPDAICPIWERFLNQVMGGSEALIKYLQRAVGYSLTGKTNEQCFFIAHGTGANGKSVFLNVIRDLSGSYGINIPMMTLMA